MILYTSRTGNIQHVIETLQELDSSIQAIDIKEIESVTNPFFLFTYTVLFGEVPEPVKEFMALHHHLCIGIIGSGNTNWGHDNFCGAAKKLSSFYRIPIIDTLDVRGMSSNYENIIKQYRERFING